MNDRLKFRAFVKDFGLIDENDNEYKKSFMIYNVGVLNNYTVGVYWESFIQQLEYQGFTKNEIEQIEEYFDRYNNWFRFTADSVEQCIGLVDKNNKPIYEGDIIRDSYDKFEIDYVISWNDGAYTTQKCLRIKNTETGEVKDGSKGGYSWSAHITQGLANHMQVIGNMHEDESDI